MKMEMKTDYFWKRLLMITIGMPIIGIGIAMFKIAELGYDPLQSFINGLNRIIAIDFGTLHLIVYTVCLVYIFFNDKRYIGIATVVFVFFTGYMSDFFYGILLIWFIDITIVTRVLFLLVGFVMLNFAVSLFFVANLGIAPYDAIAPIFAKKWPIMSFKYWRIICDTICTLLCVVFVLSTGGDFAEVAKYVGVGTLIGAFFMGPGIDFFVRKVTLPFFERTTQLSK